MQACGGLSAPRSDPARVCGSVCAHVWSPLLSGHAVQRPVVFRRRVLGPGMRVCMCITATGSPCLSPRFVCHCCLYGDARVCVCMQGPSACAAFWVCQSSGADRLGVDSDLWPFR